jgi:NADH/NAD ratio-sensing transcriptional regulator Rex
MDMTSGENVDKLKMPERYKGEDIEQHLMKLIADKKWSVRDVLDIERISEDLAIKCFNSADLLSIYRFFDTEMQTFIKEKFIESASIYIRSMVSQVLDEAEVDIGGIMRHAPETKTSAEDVVEEVVEEIVEEIPAIQSLKERIRMDAKLLTGEEMKEQGMID